MIRRRHAAAAATVALFATAPPASAAGLVPDGLLPEDPTGLLPDPGGLLPGGEGGSGGLPGGLPGDLPGGLPGGLPDGLPDGLPGDLPGGLLPGGGTGTPAGAAPEGGTGTPGTPGGTGGGLDAAGPRIAGPKKAPTVRVDSRGRFRLGGVSVTCPAGCRVSVKVRGGDGATFVARSYSVRPGGSLQLKKLKVSKKGLRALRSAGVARVTARLKASPATGASVARDVGLKLKPAR